MCDRRRKFKQTECDKGQEQDERVGVGNKKMFECGIRII